MVYIELQTGPLCCASTVIILKMYLLSALQIMGTFSLTELLSATKPFVPPADIEANTNENQNLIPQ